MKYLYYSISLFIIGLFAYSVLSKVTYKEGLTSDGETSSCSSDTTTLIYKNSGTIQSLQDKVQELMKQVNQLIISDDKQTSEIQKIQQLETKYDSLAEKADELANENKQRLIAMAKQSKAKMDDAQKQSNKIKFSK